MNKGTYLTCLKEYESGIEKCKSQIKWLEYELSELKRFFWNRTVEEAENAFYNYHLMNYAGGYWEPTTESYFNCYFNKTLKSELKKNRDERNKLAKEIRTIKDHKKKLQVHFTYIKNQEKNGL